MPHTYKIPVSSVGKIINTAVRAGVRPEELCKAANLDFHILENVDNQIPFAQLIRLYQYAERLTGDDAFGLHVGEQDSPKLYGILGYVAINSQTLGEALERLIRFQHIRTDAYRFSLEITGANAYLSYICYENCVPVERRHESEETMCSIIQFGRMMGVDWKLREVHFEHARPQDISEHERIFRAPVRFGKPITQLVFDPSMLKTPLVEADLTLGSLLERQAEELLAKSPVREIDFVSQVRQLIRENLSSGNLRIETICQKLGVSLRTLQRRLEEEGASYQKLLEETRCEMSKFYLQKQEIAICEISCLLGFSQPSAFHRAFRRWTGLTPKAFRSNRKH